MGDTTKKQETTEAQLRITREQVRRAAAELRHAYRFKTDWELVARAIRILESVTTPPPGEG